jgi:hypothetical protein
MTLLPANFGAQRLGSEAASDAERDSELRAEVRVPMAGASQSTGNDLTRLSVGNDGRLLWDGTPVVVRRRLQLSLWQKLGAIVVGLAALIIAISGGVHAAITAHDWMCGAKWVTNYCPAPPGPPKPPAPPPRSDLPN